MAKTPDGIKKQAEEVSPIQENEPFRKGIVRIQPWSAGAIFANVASKDGTFELRGVKKISLPIEIQHRLKFQGVAYAHFEFDTTNHPVYGKMVDRADFDQGLS